MKELGSPRSLNSTFGAGSRDMARRSPIPNYLSNKRRAGRAGTTATFELE